MLEVRKHVYVSEAYRQHLWGQNICIAVLDSGIWQHPDLTDHKDCIAYFKDFTSDRDTIYDPNGHGTHIAGIIAGSGKLSKGYYMGMAPQARLVILKILDNEGNGHIASVCRAMDWVVANRVRYGIRLVNISVGADTRRRAKECELLVEAVEDAWDHGLIVVAAAGNNGPEPMSITAPGTSRKIITVGASEKQYQQTTCLFSGRGPTRDCVCKPDIVAPGIGITSCNNQIEVPYIARSGTSMSVPVVTGALALLLSKYPDMTNKEVKIQLRKSVSHTEEALYVPTLLKQ